MSTPPVIRVAQLARGDVVDGLLMVDNANFKQTKNGKPFLQLVLRDQSGKIRAIKWEADRDLYRSIRVSDIVAVRGRIEEYQGNPQCILDDIRVVPRDQVPAEAFMPQGNVDTAELWETLHRAVMDVTNPALRQLLNRFLEDPALAEGLRTWPAGRTLHHAHRGGLLEHIVSIIGAATNIAKHWPQLDLDLLIAGAILHDIGKLKELSINHSIEYTDRGQLVGHVGIALQMLHEKLRDVPQLEPETVLEIEHMIVSHHGKTEYGALREPMTAEAIALHFLDNMDARLAAYFALALDTEPGPYGENWTDYHPLFGTRLFKPLRVRTPRREE